MKKVKAKVLVVGSPASGKTSLVQLYVSNGQNFLKDYNMTQAAEVSSKILQFEEQEKDVELFLFDISGQDIYESITKDLLKEADLAMYVYDCTNVDSFNAITQWYEKIKKANGNKKIPGCLVATKSDLKQLMAVNLSEAKTLAQKIGINDHFEVSAARNMDIEQPFLNLAEKMVKQYSSKI